MTQKLLIIALILVVIYLAYQQTTQPNLLTTSAQLTHLAQERNHYQTLYQKRVKKDLEHDQTQKIQQLTTNLAEVKETNRLYQTKIGDLETSLFNLAKQKIKNQKEANQLLEQLEAHWKTEKETWQQIQTNQAQSLAQERKDFYGQIEKNNQNNKNLLSKLDNFLKL